MRSLLALTDGLLALAAPPVCAGCGTPGRPLCPGCAAALAGPALRPPGSGAGAPVAGCADYPVAGCAEYTGVLPTLVNAWKERGRHDLEPVLGTALARAVAALPGADDRVLVPVPTSRAARRRRGADGVHRLALHAAAALRSGGTPARVLPALTLVRAVADQSGLSAAGRARNVEGAFAARRRAGNLLGTCGPVVVVDDVLTTGATLGAAAAAVLAAGGDVNGFACVAVTPLRRTLPPLSALMRED